MPVGSLPACQSHQRFAMRQPFRPALSESGMILIVQPAHL